MTDTETLPAEWALDMAAKAAGYRDWIEIYGCRVTGTVGASALAHARTLERLAKHEPELVPVDPLASALIAIGMDDGVKLAADLRAEYDRRGMGGLL